MLSFLILFFNKNHVILKKNVFVFLDFAFNKNQVIIKKDIVIFWVQFLIKSSQIKRILLFFENLFFMEARLIKICYFFKLCF